MFLLQEAEQIGAEAREARGQNTCMYRITSKNEDLLSVKYAGCGLTAPVKAPLGADWVFKMTHRLLERCQGVGSGEGGGGRWLRSAHAEKKTYREFY